MVMLGAPGSEHADGGLLKEEGLGTGAPSMMPLPPGPSRRDGVAMAVLPAASCPGCVW